MRKSFAAAGLPSHLSQAVATTAVLLFFKAAEAQTPPDAGALNQQIERERPAPLPRRAPPIAPAQTVPLALPDGVSVTVKSFELAGNRLLPEATLLLPLQAYLGRPLGFAELQQAAQTVANAYRDAGWIVRVYLPRQDVTDGKVVLQIVEAVFSGARVEPAPGAAARITPAQVLAIVDAQQETGEPLNATALDRALLLAGDLPGATVAGALEAGAREDETGLVLQLGEEPWVSGNAFVDNGGSRSTGAWRMGGAAMLASPWRLGDQVRADALHSEGSDYLRAAWSLPLPGPLGARGWRVAVNGSQLRYRLVGDDFAALNGRGRSGTFGAELSYPMVRSRLGNLFFRLAYDDKRFHNEANGATQSDYGVAATTASLDGNLFDDWGGGGASTFTLDLVDGRLRQHTPDPGENLALAGHWQKLRYGASRQQALAPAWAAFVAISGQSAPSTLDSSERFYLGGPQGVRAYPVNEGGGSRGELLNAEIRWRAGDELSLAGFYDWGNVRDAGRIGPAVYRGAGASVAWSGPRGLGLKLTWARRIGSNPEPTPAGRDQDGSLSRNRVWVQASLPF